MFSVECCQSLCSILSVKFLYVLNILDILTVFSILKFVSLYKTVLIIILYWPSGLAIASWTYGLRMAERLGGLGMNTVWAPTISGITSINNESSQYIRLYCTGVHSGLLLRTCLTTGPVSFICCSTTPGICRNSKQFTIWTSTQMILISVSVASTGNLR